MPANVQIIIKNIYIMVYRFSSPHVKGFFQSSQDQLASSLGVLVSS